jgi:F-type H+-transporting ATPase subunit b
MHDATHELIFPLINLGILLAILVTKLREPIRAYVASRHADIRDELQRVRDLLTLAQTRDAEFQGRIGALDAEITTLKQQVQADSAATKSRIIAEAQRLNASIIADARATSNGLYAQLRSELLADVGVRVLDRAEAIVRERLTAEDRARIRREFATQLEAVS